MIDTTGLIGAPDACASVLCIRNDIPLTSARIDKVQPPSSHLRDGTWAVQHDYPIGLL